MAVRYTSNDAINEVAVYDRTVRVQGYIDNYQCRKTAGPSVLMKFFLNNNEGSRVQCVVWGEKDVTAMEIYNLEVNDIIEINGAYARLPNMPKFNQGTVQYELQLFEGRTKIVKKGKHECKHEASNVKILLSFPDVVDHPEMTPFRIQGFIRTTFETTEIINNRGEHIGSYGCGAITDGVYKLQVHIANFANDIKYEPGQKVEVIGTITKKGGLHMMIENARSVTLISEETMTEDELMEGYRQPKSKREAQTQDVPHGSPKKIQKTANKEKDE